MKEARSAASVLRELRRKEQKSLRSAAADLGVDAGYLSRLERGEKSPSGDVMSRVASYYGVDLEWLALSEGRVPPDIVNILRDNPHLLGRLRAEYGSAPTQMASTETPEPDDSAPGAGSTSQSANRARI